LAGDRQCYRQDCYFKPHKFRLFALP
jgi:hypothetical protein